MKIALVGAGSLRTPSLVSLFYDHKKELGLDTIALFDTNQQRVAVSKKLTKAILPESPGLKLPVCSTIAEALSGADFVITSIRVGMQDARARDERIALQHGVIGQETTGAGGFSYALRTVPVMVEYAEQIEKRCPTAWLINFTNPSSIVTQAICTVRTRRTVGICDHPQAMRERIATVLGLPTDSLSVSYGGLNHLGWITSVRHNGKELLSDLLSNAEKRKNLSRYFLYDDELLEFLGVVPNEYLRYFYYPSRELRKLLELDETRGDFLSRIDNEFYRETERLPNEARESLAQSLCRYMDKRAEHYISPDSPHDAGSTPVDVRFKIREHGYSYGAVALDIMSALVSGVEREVIVNQQVGDRFPGLAPDDVAELTCRVGGDGIEVLPAPELPREALALVQTIKAYERLVVEAALKGSRQMAIRALMHHPLVASFELARDLVDSYLHEHARYLPRFCTVSRNTND